MVNQGTTSSQSIQSAPTQTNNRKSRAINRSVVSGQDGNTDLFKLEVATSKKHIGWLMQSDHWESMEHSHHFYTVGRGGEFNDRSSSIGNHFHFCEVLRDESGELILNDNGQVQIKVGPAMTEVSKKVGNKRIKTVEKPYMYDDDRGNQVFDEHTHKAKYLKSGSIRISVDESDPEYRKKVALAVSIQTNIESKEPKFPSGVSA